jgi:ADP-heptose:LPS heptosyltransferase
MRITAEMADKKKILIIKLGAFGDIIMAEGVFHDIRNHYENDHISVLTSPAYEEIYERCPWVDEVLTDPRDPRWRFDLMRKLNRRIDFDSFDVIFDLQRANRTSFYYRWFVKKASWSGMAEGCDLQYSIPPSEKISVMEEFAIQLETAGLTVTHSLSPDPSWFVDDVSEILDEAKVTEPYVVLLAGASARRTEKCWPYYDTLAERLIDKGICVLTVPGPDDFDLCRTIPGIMLTGPHKYLDFFQLAGVLQKASYVVGNDSGPSHLASHLGVPGLAIFSGHVPAYRTGIDQGNFKYFEAEQMNLMTVGKVYDEIKKTISKLMVNSTFKKQE